ncbi:uncharacterized protein LOC111072382 [Drosophila obscura]|uniref:uncharacterized protein LOC111072382 n=1 Tax=Drosophila obscura TaxID=7282 RepID=UPI001BB1AB5C|nr:uncharacterized protein LOC111072382 [Drosophila obscura]
MCTFSKTMRLLPLPVLFLALLGTPMIFGQDNCNSTCQLVEYTKALENSLSVRLIQNKQRNETTIGTRMKNIESNLLSLSCKLVGFLGEWRTAGSKSSKEEFTNPEEYIVKLPKIRIPELFAVSCGIRDTLRKYNPSDEEKQHIQEMETLLKDIIPEKLKKTRLNPQLYANAINSMCAHYCIVPDLLHC